METPKGLATRLSFLDREKLKCVLDNLFASLEIAFDNREERVDEIAFGYVG